MMTDRRFIAIHVVGRRISRVLDCNNVVAPPLDCTVGIRYRPAVRKKATVRMECGRQTGEQVQVDSVDVGRVRAYDLPPTETAPLYLIKLGASVFCLSTSPRQVDVSRQYRDFEFCLG
jgi:hypothetical protein